MATGGKDGGRKGQGAGGGLRRTSDGLDETEESDRPRTEEELDQFTRELVDTMNEAIRKVGTANDKLASFVFKKLFVTNVKAALDPDKAPTREYLRLRRRAGNTLDMDRSELSLYVRIGALNYDLEADGWLNLDWSKKVALLPLANLKDGRRKLRAGMKHAMGEGIGVRQLREWVANTLPADRATKQPQLGIGAGEKFTSVGVRLGNADDRAVLVEKVLAAPPERRKEFLRDLKETARNLAALLREFEDG